MGVDRSLRIVALDEPALAFHHAAFAIGEVPMCRFFWRSGRLGFMRVRLSLSSSLRFLSGLGFQFCLGLLDSSQALLSVANPFRHFISAATFPVQGVFFPIDAFGLVKPSLHHFLE